MDTNIMAAFGVFEETLREARYAESTIEMYRRKFRHLDSFPGMAATHRRPAGTISMRGRKTQRSAASRIARPRKGSSVCWKAILPAANSICPRYGRPTESPGRASKALPCRFADMKWTWKPRTCRTRRWRITSIWPGTSFCSSKEEASGMSRA